MISRRREVDRSGDGWTYPVLGIDFQGLAGYIILTITRVIYPYLGNYLHLQSTRPCISRWVVNEFEGILSHRSSHDRDTYQNFGRQRYLPRIHPSPGTYYLPGSAVNVGTYFYICE